MGCPQSPELFQKPVPALPVQIAFWAWMVNATRHSPLSSAAGGYSNERGQSQVLMFRLLTIIISIFYKIGKAFRSPKILFIPTRKTDKAKDSCSYSTARRRLGAELTVQRTTLSSVGGVARALARLNGNDPISPKVQLSNTPILHYSGTPSLRSARFDEEDQYENEALCGTTQLRLPTPREERR
jgi:hypothetical protein